jgi:hypothetical protein
MRCALGGSRSSSARRRSHSVYPAALPALRGHGRRPRNRGSEPIGVFALNFEEPRAFDVERQLTPRQPAQSRARCCIWTRSAVNGPRQMWHVSANHSSARRPSLSAAAGRRRSSSRDRDLRGDRLQDERTPLACPSAGASPPWRRPGPRPARGPRDRNGRGAGAPLRTW